MSKLRFRISISLDGFTAGANQSVKEPLGVGGEDLHQWVVGLDVWRKAHGKEGGARTESSAVVEEELANIGATIMGRNMFGGHPGPWAAKEPWDGWWGKNPPFHHPVFVLTQHAREKLVLEGGNSFTFVTNGIEAALEAARKAAGGRDVALAGGANIARQYLAAGLVDEMELHIAPILLGQGERLFDGAADYLKGLSLVRTVGAPNVTHLKFAKR
ncbi:dihydrofolate reductase family protein [Pendulispora brunnea]|uniref:Dihydrofolate reductase family protein n=1 Tax=Pendulispora brunnea TaxID=2905690 RepID=A0ABZ2K7Y4_9BACT